jgi:hypothetical protein
MILIGFYSESDNGTVVGLNAVCVVWELWSANQLCLVSIVRKYCYEALTCCASSLSYGNTAMKRKPAVPRPYRTEILLWSPNQLCLDSVVREYCYEAQTSCALCLSYGNTAMKCKPAVPRLYRTGILLWSANQLCLVSIVREYCYETQTSCASSSVILTLFRRQ